MAKGATNQKRKGGSYERLVCKRLSLWASGLTRDDLFWRTPMSGGRASLPSAAKHQGREAHAGDIQAQNYRAEPFTHTFLIECKHYKNLMWEQALYGHKGQLDKVWFKPREQARVLNKEALSIVRQNNRPDMVVVSPEGLEILEAATIKGEFLEPMVLFVPYDMYILRLEDMLTCVSYRKFVHNYKVKRKAKKKLKRYRCVSL